jgi:hypothetical protein
MTVPSDTSSRKYVEWMAKVWKMNDERNKTSNFYPDGTPKIFYLGKPWLNIYGYGHATKRCSECGKWECDPNGIGHYRG